MKIFVLFSMNGKLTKLQVLFVVSNVKQYLLSLLSFLCLHLG